MIYMYINFGIISLSELNHDKVKETLALTLLHSERPELYAILAFQSEVRLSIYSPLYPNMISNVIFHSEQLEN